MARRPNVIRPVRLTTTLPEDIWTQLTLYLHSDLEERVPKGAYQQFIVDRCREFFKKEPVNAKPRTSEPNLPVEAEGHLGNPDCGGDEGSD